MYAQDTVRPVMVRILLSFQVEARVIRELPYLVPVDPMNMNPAFSRVCHHATIVCGAEVRKSSASRLIGG